MNSPTLNARIAILPFAICQPLIVFLSLWLISKLTQRPRLRLALGTLALGGVIGSELLQFHIYSWITRASDANDDGYFVWVVLLQNLTAVAVGLWFFSRLRQRELGRRRK